MRVRVIKLSGLFWLVPPAPNGAVIDVPDAEGKALVANGHAVEVGGELSSAPPSADAPLQGKKDRAFKGGKKK